MIQSTYLRLSNLEFAFDCGLEKNFWHHSLTPSFQPLYFGMLVVGLKSSQAMPVIIFLTAWLLVVWAHFGEGLMGVFGFSW